MFGFDWRHYTPIGVGLAIALALGALGLHNNHQRAKGADCGPNQNQQCTADDIRAAGIAVIGERQAPDPKPNPDRDEWRKEKDLDAQWGMVWWASVSAFASLISIAATVVGIVFVKLTLDATRAALREAKTSSDAAVLMARAMIGTELPILTPRWVGVEYVETDAPFIDGEGPYGGATDGMESPAPHGFVPIIPFRNFGRTPAFVETISLGYAVEQALPATPVFTKEKSLDRDTIVSAEPQKEPENVMVDFGIELSPEQLDAMGNGTASLWFYFKVAYRDFMNDIYEDTFCARYAQRHDEISPYDFASDGNPPAAYTKRRQPKEAQQPAQT